MINENEKNEFLSTMRTLVSVTPLYIPFNCGNVRKLVLNNEFIYLWQDAKGDACYCFTLLEKEFFTTSIAKLGSVLTGHFGCEIEVINNEKEHIKKLISATNSLNKSLTDNEQYKFYNDTSQSNQFPSERKDFDVINIDMLGNQLVTIQPPDLVPYSHQKHPLHNQEKLYMSSVQLATYSMESHINTLYIKINELPVVHNMAYRPIMKQAFCRDEKGLSCRNKFIPTEFMITPSFNYDLNNSYILMFIFFMAKKDVIKTLQILKWLFLSFSWLNKASFALVLYSNNDTYMKLFYEEIIEPLFNSKQCEKIENSNLDKKSLSTLLHEKIIYNFDNITDTTILNEPAKELTNRLIHKNQWKLNGKNLTTVGNILITSTTNYIPMIAKDVPSIVVNVDSAIDNFCNEYNIKPHKYEISKLIKHDFNNFVSILKSLDISSIFDLSGYGSYDVCANVLDGDIDPLEVFDKIIRDMDIVPFEAAIKTEKDEKLAEEIRNNFNKNRVDKNHLLDYFRILFRNGIDKTNRALIADLKKFYSKTDEPFENEKTHVRDGRAYYFL
ncbi:MAG: hypothetical protein PHF17_01585 [Arcobacteraceae bacterium]|nr:hypothetical protein [Arcobacteraceae bacterium]